MYEDTKGQPSHCSARCCIISWRGVWISSPQGRQRCWKRVTVTQTNVLMYQHHFTHSPIYFNRVKLACVMGEKNRNDSIVSRLISHAALHRMAIAAALVKVWFINFFGETDILTGARISPSWSQLFPELLHHTYSFKPGWNGRRCKERERELAQRVLKHRITLPQRRVFACFGSKQPKIYENIKIRLK